MINVKSNVQSVTVVYKDDLLMLQTRRSRIQVFAASQQAVNFVFEFIKLI